MTLTGRLPLAMAMLLVACSSSRVAPVASSAAVDPDDERVTVEESAPLPSSGPRCVARGDLPDPACTPGAVATSDLDVICHQRTRERRHVTAATKREVLEAYGVTRAADLEIDHLVPLCLGGANDIANLWPEMGPRSHDKDRAEALLCRRVCRGDMRLEDAQRIMMTDWRMGLR